MSSRRQAAQSPNGASISWPATSPTSRSGPWCRDWLRQALGASRLASEFRMMTLAEIDLPSATDCEIAALNLESARRRAWARFAHDSRLPRVAEAIVDFERLAAQFLGNLDALDRLETLAAQFA